MSVYSENQNNQTILKSSMKKLKYFPEKLSKASIYFSEIKKKIEKQNHKFDVEIHKNTFEFETLNFLSCVGLLTTLYP